MSTETHNNAPRHGEDRLKVLIIVGEFPPRMGGISDYTAHLSRELAAVGCQVKVITTRIEDVAEHSFRQGAEVRRIMFNWHLSEIKSILGIIDEMGSDTIVNLHYGSFWNRRRPMVIFLPLVLRLLRPRCRVIITIHEFLPQRTRARAWAMPMIMAAHGLIFFDPSDQEPLRRWTRLKRPRMECVPLAPNILPVPLTDDKRRDWRHSLGVLDDTPIITFFGGVREGKGLLDLLEAINNLRSDAIPAYLLLIGWFELGYGRNRKYCNKVREAFRGGLSASWIKLAENCPSDVVSKYLHASDVAVFPFTRGARPNNGSMLAAVAHGLPVVTTQGVDTPERFAEQYGVVLMPAGNPAALSTCLKRILLSDEEKRRLKRKALFAAKAFSWASIAGKTMAFYASFKGSDVSASLIPDVSRFAK